MASWWTIAIGALAGIAIIVAAIAVPLAIRRRGLQPVPRLDAGGAVVAGPAWPGRMVTAAIVVGWIFAIATALSAAISAAAVFTGTQPVPIRTDPYWPRLPMPEDHIGGISFVRSGGYTEATTVVTDLSLAAKVWDALAILIGGAAFVIAAIVVVRLCQRLRDGRGVLGASRSFTTLAIVSLVAGLLWQIADQLGGYLAAEQVAPRGLGSVDLWSDWPVASGTLFIVNGWPILPFLAFGALAAAFRYAERLQRDTEGLV